MCSLENASSRERAVKNMFTIECVFYGSCLGRMCLHANKNIMYNMWNILHIIRYSTDTTSGGGTVAASTTGSPTVTNTGSHIVYKFTASGSITF